MFLKYYIDLILYQLTKTIEKISGLPFLQMTQQTDRLTYRDAPHLRILKPQILRHTKFILPLHLIVDNADIPNSFPLILTTPDPWL